MARLPLLAQLRGDPLALARGPLGALGEPEGQDRDRRPRRRLDCPYCAVGCGQSVYVKDEQVIQIEGDPDSPVSRGRLCPKGSASTQLVTNPNRLTRVKHRRPHATEWEELPLDTAMDMIADRVIAARAKGWQDTVEQKGEQVRVNRTLGFAHLGGATLDNEENYSSGSSSPPWAPCRSRTSTRGWRRARPRAPRSSAQAASRLTARTPGAWITASRRRRTPRSSIPAASSRSSSATSPATHRRRLAGSRCERWSVFSSGKASARDPRYVVGRQRARRERRE